MRVLRFFRSLRVQLTVVILLVLALGLGSLLVMAGAQMEDTTLESFTHEQQVLALVVANNLAEPVGYGQSNSIAASWAMQGENMRDVTSMDVNVSAFAVSGNILATTRDDPQNIPLGMPEVNAALDGTIASTIRQDRVYVAVPIVLKGTVVGAVWLDTSLAPVDTSLQQHWLALIGAAFGALILAFLAGWWLSSRIIRPLTQIRQVADEMAGGNLNAQANVSQTTEELDALANAFNNMGQEVSLMMEKQREFVANASHELKSPLAAIKIRAEALAFGTVEGERARNYAAEINDETSRLAQLVADLLQLSRIDSGSIAPPSEPINTGDELMAAVRYARPRAAAKQQNFEVYIQPDIPDTYVYASDLRTMVTNLLDNAIKYTPEEGRINLTACWNDKSLIVEVRDNGEGIPQADLARVTERFFRVDRSHARNVPGTGLGLALVLATAQRYHGDLHIESTSIPGEGTFVRLCLSPETKPVASPLAVGQVG